jgi:hypothetical protein
MTDYYPVILRAVAALETNTFEARRAIYNHARAAQSEQLRNRPFVKKDFDHERLMLEDAISRVEIETTNKRIATGPSPGTRVRPSNIAPIPMTPLPPVYEDKDKTFLARKRVLPSLSRLALPPLAVLLAPTAKIKSGIRKCLSIIREFT